MANTLQVWQLPKALGDLLPKDMTQELKCLLNFFIFCDNMPLKIGFLIDSVYLILNTGLYMYPLIVHTNNYDQIVLIIYLEQKKQKG